MIHFSIVIPNFHGQQFLSKCLESLVCATKKTAKTSFEIIMVDNASTDDSIKIFNIFAKKNTSSTLIFNLLPLDSNTGFASAVNRGIIVAKYEYVCLCNNDLTLSPNWFKIIAQEISNNTNPKVATFCGLVLNKEGTHIESEGLRFFFRGKAQNINNGQLYQQSSFTNRKPSYIWGSSAALVVYNKAIISKVGLFDDHYFAYIEDVDIAFRLHMNGFLTVFLPSAVSYHFGGGTSNKFNNMRQILTLKNWIYFIQKNYKINEVLLNFPGIFLERLHNLSYLIKSINI